ncbi:protein of unknown function [Methylacidimicrobium sp. AP8]|nr:protein of unknown function [Methylacidimicrobium sp. AP8]
MLPSQLLEIARRLGLLEAPQPPRRKRLSFLEESPDPWLRRGVLSHALTEMVASGPGAGLLLSAALRFCARIGLPVALVDGADSFDPKSALAGPAPPCSGSAAASPGRSSARPTFCSGTGAFPWSGSTSAGFRFPISAGSPRQPGTASAA